MASSFMNLRSPASSTNSSNSSSDVIEEVRAVRVAGDLRLLPGVEVGVDVLELLGGFLAQLDDFIAHGLAAGGFQLGDLLFEIGEGLFEIEIGGGHLSLPGGVSDVSWGNTGTGNRWAERYIAPGYGSNCEGLQGDLARLIRVRLRKRGFGAGELWMWAALS